MFEHILWHVETVTYNKVLGYPSLIFGILIEQNKDLVTTADILGPLIGELRISHKLYEGHHLRNVPSGKKGRIMKEKVLETFLEFEPELVPSFKFQQRKLSTSISKKKTRLLDKTIKSYENVLAHHYE